jgi:hypothetical protein
VKNLTTISAGIIAVCAVFCGFNAPAQAGGDSIAASVSINFGKGCNCIDTASSAIAIGRQNAFAITTAGESSTSGSAGASAGSILMQGLSANGASVQQMGAESLRNHSQGLNILTGNSIEGNSALTIAQ